MTHQEFADRTGLKPTNEEYAKIEALYIAAGNMDKDIFCKEYVNIGMPLLVQTLLKQVETLNRQLEERRNELDDCHKRFAEFADLLIGKSCVYNDTDFYNKAVQILGKKEVALRKITMGLPLWKEDIEYISVNLN